MIPSLVVTSWSDKDDDRYGPVWIEGLVAHWGWTEAKYKVLTDQEMLADPEVRAFRARESDSKTTSGHPRWGALKWSWKVFALTMEPMPTTGWMVWIDGDVEFIKTPTREFFDVVCPENADITYLGRPWAYASETGFVAYRMDCPAVRDLLRAMRQTYLTGAFRTLKNWGDNAVFDQNLRQLGLAEADNTIFDHHRDQIPSLRLNNLAAHCAGPDLHVWPATVLAPYLAHHKGPGRKAAAYP